MSKETHPYLHNFDSSKKWKYLIIGTFPPNKELREGKKSYVDYFYGNDGSLWKILNATGLYPDFDFKIAKNIISWQNQYSVGVTDVIKQCRRIEGKEKSPADKNLVVDLNLDLNTDLKSYILCNIDFIDKLYFTSGNENENGNSAFWLFTKLMGKDLKKIPSPKIIKLPAPSGEFLRTVFTKAKANFGLKDDFYEYLKDKFPSAIEVAKITFEQKESSPKTRTNRKNKKVKVTIKRFPNCPNYPSLYRIDLYKDLMPKAKVQ